MAGTQGQDLTGPAAAVVRDHARLADGIQDVLLPEWREMLERGAALGDPVQARRAAWVTRETAAREEPGQDFCVRVVVPDPKPGIPAGPEARIMIGGIPVIAAAFDKGPACPPEYLLHSGRLGASETPHEVMLAEAYCTEGCCVTDIQDQDPETVAEQVIESMRDTDPKTRAEMIGGSRDSAEKPGLTCKEPPIAGLRRTEADGSGPRTKQPDLNHIPP